MARTACVILVILCAAASAQLYQRPDYGPGSSYNRNSISNSNSNYHPASRSNYDPGSLDYGHIYNDRSSSNPAYVAPPSRTPAVRGDDSNQRLQLAYESYLRELRAASAHLEPRRDPLPPPHDLQPAAQHNDAASSSLLERSDSYGYGDDCSDLDTLSLVLGLGALAAFAVWFYIQQQNAAAARSAPWAPMLGALQNRLPEPIVMDALTEGACRSLDALQRRSTQRTRQQTEHGSGRDIGGDCLDGLVGPAAGFFALGAIVAYALSQAAMAAGARSSDAGIDPAVLNAAARQMLVALTAPDKCVAHELCQVTRSAGHVTPQARTPIKLASVALAWYAAQLRQGSSSNTLGHYSEYCWSLVDGLRGSCPATQGYCRTS